MSGLMSLSVCCFCWSYLGSVWGKGRRVATWYITSWPQCSVYTICSPVWPNWVKNSEADSERAISGKKIYLVNAMS